MLLLTAAERFWSIQSSLIWTTFPDVVPGARFPSLVLASGEVLLDCRLPPDILPPGVGVDGWLVPAMATGGSISSSADGRTASLIRDASPSFGDILRFASGSAIGLSTFDDFASTIANGLPSFVEGFARHTPSMPCPRGRKSNSFEFALVVQLTGHLSPWLPRPSPHQALVVCLPATAPA